VLELRDLRKRYQVGSGKPIIAVDGVSMRVGAGELVALYGPSGSGKTTLLQLVEGALRPDGGQVLVAGREISAMSRREEEDYRLNELGVIGQPHNLIPGARAIDSASLKLLLTHGRKLGTPVVEGLLRELGLGERMRHRTEKLSLGERQRVLIAMALATEPKLVLADEPTGSLDSHSSREVLGLLRRLCVERGAALLLATHDPLAAGFADRVHELRDGRLEEYRPGELLVAPGSLREAV
jgi:putative ABC transport system ATP-binding protein